MVSRFARQRFGESVDVEVRPLRGGLEAAGIARAVVRDKGKSVGSFVVKPFAGAVARRELDIYRLFTATQQLRIAPALLGWSYTDRGKSAGYMFLEFVASEKRWPWRDLSCSALVVERLAALHRLNSEPMRAVLAGSWDYEKELKESARSTLDVYRAVYAAGVRPGGRPMLHVFERVVEKLPALRRALMSFAGTTMLHGDAHPGNVIIRGNSALFLDWGRARLGSPLEDLSTWIHSLAFWEPEAKRRHDTLIARYRKACGAACSRTPSDYRDALVLAGATNALAGALRYHLSVASDRNRPPREQVRSYLAAADWLRLMRRADVAFAR